MKKSLLFVLPVFLLASCGGQTESLTKKNQEAFADTNQASVYETLLSSLTTKALKSDATITASYANATYHTIDEVSSSARRTYDIINNRAQNLKYFAKDAETNGTIQKTLTISNTVLNTTLNAGGQNETPVDFDATYGSPFLALNEDNIENFFSLSATETGYEAIPTDFGATILATSLDAFYPMHDSYVWDTRTVSSYAADVKISTDKSGVPTAISFKHTRKDAYGGILENVNATLSVIDTVEPLEPVESSLTSAQRMDLRNAISGTANKIAGGNFTQTVHMTQAEGAFNGINATYHSYYDLPYPASVENGETPELPEKGFGLMLSDFNYFAEQSSTGDINTVYLGLGYGWQSSEEIPMDYGYWAIGVTPATSYFGQVSSEFYTSIAAATPTLGSLSADFFTTTGNNIYTFDLTTFDLYDRTFAIDLMTALLGPGDYASHISPEFYVSNSTTMEFTFTDITIDLTDSENPTFALSYIDESGKSQTTTTSFSDFGTTDLLNIDGASAEFNKAISVALDVLF